MITATQSQLKKKGFQRAGEYFNLFREGIRIIAKRVQGKNYQVHALKDAKGNYYGPTDISESGVLGNVKSIDDLFPILNNPPKHVTRWRGIDNSTKGLLYKIAQTSKSEDAQPLINAAAKRIELHKSSDPELYKRASIEFEAAVTHWEKQTPERYLDQYKN